MDIVYFLHGYNHQGKVASETWMWPGVPMSIQIARFFNQQDFLKNN